MPDGPESITVSNAGFTLPTSELLTGRGFITGKSGSGKSNTASVIAEELLEHGLPLLVVDTDGEYYGLKGRYELLHVGAERDCDAVVEVEHAEKLAELALVQNVPVILDISGYLEEAEARELVRRVLERLFELGKRVRKPFPVFVEEIHEFLPQTGGSDELSDTLITVAKRGRKRGIGLCGLSQRPAAVDKDFITQCDWLVWHRLTWDNDKRVAAQMLGTEAAAAIDELANGEAILMTDWDEQVTRIRFRRKRTFDAGATPGLDDLDRGPASPVRTALLSELADEGTDLNAIDVEGLGGEVEPPSPDARGGDEGEVAEGDASGDDPEPEPTKLEVAAADDGLRADVVTIPNRPSSRLTYTPPEPAEDEPFDPVWELGHLVVFLTTRLARAAVGLTTGLAAVAVRMATGLADVAVGTGQRLRHDVERLGRTGRRRVGQPTVRELEEVAAYGVSDRLIAVAALALLAVAVVLLLLA